LGILNQNGTLCAYALSIQTPAMGFLTLLANDKRDE